MAETLKFAVEVDDSEIKRVSDALKKAAKTTDSETGKQFDAATKADLEKRIAEIKEYNDKIQALKRNISSLELSGNETGAENNRKWLEQDLARMTELVNEYNAKIEELSSKSESLSFGGGETSSEAQSHEQAAEATDKHATALERLSAIMRTIGTAIGLDFVEQEEKGAAEAGEQLANATEKVAASQSKASSAGGFFNKVLAQMQGLMGRVTSALHSHHRAHGRSLSTMIRSVFIYRTITRMLNALKTSLANVAASDASMSSSLASIKSNLLMAFAPIANYVIPLLRELLSLLAAVASAFASFMGGLFGIAPAAQKNSAALLAQAGATKAAGGAAGGAAKTIAQFDEINQMNESGGGGGGGGGAGWNFDNLEDTPIGQFAQKLRDAIMAQNWRAVGTMLGEKINEAVNMIPWGKIGHTIGFGLNAAVQTAYWFLETIDFNKIGSSLAELVNNALKEIEFEYLGATLIRLITSVFDMVIGFLSELDWGLVTSSISNFIIGAFNEITNWINSINWGLLGGMLWLKIKAAFGGVNWEGLNISISNAIKAAISAALDLLYGFLEGIGTDIMNWIAKGMSGDEAAEAESQAIWQSLLNAIDLLSGASIVRAVIGGMLDWLFGEEFVNELKHRLYVAIKGAYDWVAEGLSKIGIILPEFPIQEIAEPIDAYNVGKTIGEEYKSGFDEGTAELAEAAAKRLEEIRSEKIEGGGGGGDNMGLGAGRAWVDGFNEGVTENLDVSEAFNAIETGVSGSAAKIKREYTSATTSARSRFSSLAGSANSAFNSVSSNIVGNLASLMSNYLSVVNAGIANTIASLNTLSNAASSGAAKGFEAFKVPQMATGGVIPANHRFLAMLGDQTSGTNVEAPLDTIVNAMQIALNNSGGGGNSASAIRQALSGMSVKVDGRTLGYIVADNINKNRRSDGKLALNL